MTRDVRIEELARALGEWKPGDPPSLTWFLGELRDLVGAEFVGAYRPSAVDEGWTLDFMLGMGATAKAHVQAFHDCVAGIGDTDLFVTYNPYAVDVEQRNRVVSLADLPRDEVAERHDAVLAAVGARGHDQVRVLVCDGPRLLSWVGATRRERFTAREAAVLRALTAPLCERLRLERQIDTASMRAATMEAALEALQRPAFLAGPRGTIEYANSFGTALLERYPRRTVESVSESLRRPDEAAEYAVTRLTVVGHPPCALAVRKERGASLEERVAFGARVWGLTTRQTRVLELVAKGFTNQQIADALRCAKVTVENHLTHIYRRSGARSRADLLAGFLA